MSIERLIKPLDISTWPAFAALVENCDGFPSGCWSMAFHPEGVGKDTTVALNRQRKMDRVMAGDADAALIFDGDACVGWCQFGSPEELPRIKSRAAYERVATPRPDWRIACCYAAKGHRRQGGATASLGGALELIAGLGGGSSRDIPSRQGRYQRGFSSMARSRPTSNSASRRIA